MSTASEEKQEDTVNPVSLREYRKSLRQSQFSFWSRFGVSQSRGSRFEMGKAVPPPVAILLKLYFDGVITDEDLDRKQAAEGNATRKFRTLTMLGKSAPNEWL